MVVMLTAHSIMAQDRDKLWLRNTTASPVKVVSARNSPTLTIAKEELQQGWQGAAGASLTLTITKNKAIKADGFRFVNNGIEATSDMGLLYGVYELLRRQQTGQTIPEEINNPSYDRRLLNHWDNRDGSVERGYAGKSIFWRKDNPFEVTTEDRNMWRNYARANASIGINGVAVNNVNASPLFLTTDYLNRIKVIADVLRPYGVRVYLSANFSSPKVIGGLATSDPLDGAVVKWWSEKAKEIYSMIPDFGGFLVKANSEGQPGPQDFGRTHVDGANVLADAVKPFGGIVMWRSFVYSPNDNDRAKQAYTEFVPFDGKFRDNVIIQVKNGPIDFQPREPFSPLFGAMKKTAVMPELQITQEYLGHSVHLVYLAPMWEEVLKSDTYQEGPGSTVARVTDGSIFQQKHTAIAAVANIGLDQNWSGHHFGQANWYAYGRMAWNHNLRSEQIADEWIKLTYYPGSEKPGGSAFYNAEWNENFLVPVKSMMMESKEAAVNYMTPLGLHHIMKAHIHYGPGPWWAPKSARPDWTPRYYHQADTNGIGFNRTKSGSDAVSQYHEPLASWLNDPATCPDIFLLWFHHLPWDYKMKSGQTLWDEICMHYDKGVKQVRGFQQTWDRAERYIDTARFKAVQSKLRSQVVNAMYWRDAALLYFQQYSKRPIPYHLERPVNDLDAMIEADETTKER